MVSGSDLNDVQIYRMSTAEHECPWGLKAISLLNAKGISYVDHRLTSDEQVSAFKQKHGVVTTPQIFAAGESIGGYTDLAELLGSKAEGADYSYTPVIAVFGTTFLMALAMGSGILQLFMGFSICMLAMLKLMDVDSFAISFAKYDLITQRVKAWAKIYPGIELLIGLGFLMSPAPQVTGWAALLVAIPGMVSVIKAVCVDKLALNCACVGGNTKTPLGIISFTEYAMLALMGFVVAFGLSF